MEHSVTLAGCSPIEFPVARLSLASILFFLFVLFTSLNSTQSCTKIARLFTKYIYNVGLFVCCLFSNNQKRRGKLFICQFFA